MRWPYVIIAVGLCVLAVTFLVLQPRKAPATKLAVAEATLSEASHQLATGRSVEARENLVRFVQKHGADTDLEIQDQVTRARMTLAYVAMRNGKPLEAQRAMESAVSAHKGSKTIDPGYGSLTDQAAYHSLVALQAQGKKVEAVAAYMQYIVDRPLSPLCTAARNRVVGLTTDRSVLQRVDTLLQKAIDAQESKARLDAAMCGPNSVLKLLSLLGHESPTIEEVARLCNTTDQGSSMASLADALSTYGVVCSGFELNLRDFCAIKTPAIWLQDGHFTVIVSRGPRGLTVYDPMFERESLLPYPGDKQTDFTAKVLTIDSNNRETIR